MIKIDISNIYLNNLKENSLFCLCYLKNSLGYPLEVYKTFKTFSELKIFCEDNTSDLHLSVSCMTPEEIEELNSIEFDYSNYD